jgi:hypothetical protein
MPVSAPVAGPAPIRVNGVDLRQKQMHLISIDGWGSTPGWQVAMQPVPGMAGVVPLSNVEVRERVITCRFLLAVNTLAEREARARWCQQEWQGVTELRLLLSDDTVMRAIPQRVGLAPWLSADPFLEPVTVLEAVFLCADVSRYAWVPDAVALRAGVPAPVPLGGSNSLPSVWLHGLTGQTTLSYLNPQGDTLGSLTVTRTTSSNEVVEIDFLTPTIWLWTSGSARSERYDLKTGGRWFTLRADAGLPVEGGRRGMGALLLSDGHGVAYYRQAWTY